MIIVAEGAALFPFLEHFIKDPSEIPPDVSIRIIYILFLMQTVSSYLFVTPQMLLSADQRQYTLTVCETFIKLIMYILQILVLAMTGNFTMCLLIGILATIFCNIIVSTAVKLKYKAVFEVNQNISESEKKELFSDTRATLCHKVGYTILNGTDSVVLSSFVGLVAAGLYANYLLIINGVYGIVEQMFSSFASSLGNAHFTLDRDERYYMYRRLQFMNFWVAGLFTVCLTMLISDFIAIWLGENMVFDGFTVFVVCFQFYLTSVRRITNSYTYGSGFFVKDKIRPFIEAAINIVVSIILAIKIGIAGVFLGTVISMLLTAIWREPMILYRYEFKRPMWEYWKYFTIFTVGTVLISAGLTLLKQQTGFACTNIGWWFAEAAVCIVVYNLIMLCVFAWNEDLRYCVSQVRDIMLRLKKQSPRHTGEI